MFIWDLVSNNMPIVKRENIYFIPASHYENCYFDTCGNPTHNLFSLSLLIVSFSLYLSTLYCLPHYWYNKIIAVYTRYIFEFRTYCLFKYGSFSYIFVFSEMNRHHYALFVRNCRLILLLRRDFGEGDLNIFRPAEWRWKLPEVSPSPYYNYLI